MSRSYRHTPMMGIAVCRSEKSWKRLDHKILRQRLRQNLAHERYEAAEVDSIGVNVWMRGKDGKQRWSLTDPTVFQSHWRMDTHYCRYYRHPERCLGDENAEELQNHREWMRK